MERRRRVSTREGEEWQHAAFWRSHDQRETKRRGTPWCLSDPPKTTPPCPRQPRLQCWRAPPRYNKEMLPSRALPLSMPPI